MKRTRSSPAVRSAPQMYMSAKSHRGSQQLVALYAKHWTDNTGLLALITSVYVCVCADCAMLSWKRRIRAVAFAKHCTVALPDAKLHMLIPSCYWRQTSI